MLSITKTKEKESSGWRLFKRSNSAADARPILRQLFKSLEKELKLRLKRVNSSAAESLLQAEAMHLAIDNLTNVALTVEGALQTQQNSLNVEIVLGMLEGKIEKTKAVLRTDLISQSKLAGEIGTITLNLLFCARQAVKQKFSTAAPPDLTTAQVGSAPETVNPTKLLSTDRTPLSAQRMIISSTLLYQLHHSLFPAERMLVGAGRKKGQTIEIDGIFDVTGNASAGYVKADADRLARALIIMSETDSYFAFWIHSHPGRGRDMTCPSSTDLNQEAEWLKDYSPALVNAIIVEDRFVRFWGKALAEKRVVVEVAGAGIKLESEAEYLFRLEF